MLGAFAFIVNLKRTFIAQMLFTVLTKLSRITLLTLLADYFAVYGLLLKRRSLTKCMYSDKMLFKTWFTIYDLASSAFYVNNVQLAI